MPVEGPNGLYMYLPYEAYEAIGHQLYRGEWMSPFSPGPLLPDPPMAKAIIERGGKNAKIIRSMGDPDSDEYKLLQIKSARTHKVLGLMREVLSFGKARAWRKVGNNWQPIDYLEWGEEGTLFDQLLEELHLHYVEHKISSGDIAIEQASFRISIEFFSQAIVEANVPLGQRARPGRKGYDWVFFREELSRLETKGALPQESQSYREAICRALYEWHCSEFPSKKAPKIETIKRRLKPDLDRIAKDYYGIQ
tara:strand:+ start:556 stop:1308 length:753 start_codon:yes stop_codon:yes gene_type:complete